MSSEFEPNPGVPDPGVPSPPPTDDDDESPDYIGLAVMIIIGVLTGILAIAREYMDSKAIDLLFLLSGVGLISVVIWQACDSFADAAQWVGTTFRLPGSVRGATLDAVASSMPELFSGIFFVYVAFTVVGDGVGPTQIEAGAEGYGSTIATCAGSAVYNMVLIPALCALVISFTRKSRPTIDVEKEVIARDGMWFVACELLLIVFLFSDRMYWWMGAVFLGMYLGYIINLVFDARKYRRSLTAEQEQELDERPDSAGVLFGFFEVQLNMVTVWLTLAISTLIAAAACFFLVKATILTAEILEVPTFFVAVILAAAASSVPDTFLAIGSAKRGDDSGAVSNAFGSNIFDICICLSIPLFVNLYLTNWQPVSLTQDGEPIPGLIGLRILLVVLTAITLGVMWHKKQLTRNKAYFLCLLYLVFIAYAVIGSLRS